MARVQRNLSALESSSSASSQKNSQPRKPRGANKKAILALFEGNDSVAFTTTEAAKKAGIVRTSTQTVLHRLKTQGILEQTEDGYWRKK